MTLEDVGEGVRFLDPETCLRGSRCGALVTRMYHRTTLWLMLHDNGQVEELTNSDLRRIVKDQTGNSNKENIDA